MKKTLFLLIALVASMSINAQTTKVMTVLDGTSELATYKVKPTVKVVFKDVPTPTTGTATRTGNVEVNWVQLWENGPKFAEYNVGAGANSAAAYAQYYTWGGIVNKNNEDSNTGRDALTGNNDTATYLWGSNWRMPTKEEFEALLANCDVLWTKVDNIPGLKFTGKVAPYDANSIFLPASGYCFNGTVTNRDTQCFYWSSAPNPTNPTNQQAFRLFYQSTGALGNVGARTYGASVRAVLVETIK